VAGPAPNTGRSLVALPDEPDGRLAALKEAMLAVESASAGKDDSWLLRLCRVTGQV
jgi:hypothetical protein